MIHIVRPVVPPDILQTTGKRKRAALCALYTRYSVEFIAGARKFPFDSEVYGHVTVKQTLMSAQHNKCCFCESKIGADGDIEHFRPKAASTQGPGEPMIVPGYYWLAYEWNNLLLSCPPCNQRNKRNYFPLVDPSSRARSHVDDITREVPLFINPAEQDPQDFIGFRVEIAFPIDDNPFGTATIQSLNLNRESLTERRRDLLATLGILRKLVSFEGTGAADARLQEVIDDAKAFLQRAVADDAEFAAMARAASVTLGSW